MTVLVQFAALPVVHNLGWTLVHFCWEGALVGLLLACILAILPLRASRLRYAAACAAMALMVVSPLITFGVLATQAPTAGEHFAIQAINESLIGLNGNMDQGGESWTVRLERGLDQSLPAVIGVWLTGVLMLLCRLNLGLMATRKMRLPAAEPPNAELREILLVLQQRLGIERTVRLVNSALVQAPTVIGWLRPAILIPAGCMLGMSATQVEAVFAHELAHIRRHDYLVSLFQMVVEAVLFYHPAVWWVSGQMRREREHCCDDLAVTVSGDRLAYAKALSILEERRGPVPAGAFAATGGVLKMRIARLLGVKQAPAFPRAAGVVLLAAAAGLAAFVTARAQTASSEQSPSTTESTSPQQVGPHGQWLNKDVRWIITPAEKHAFLQLRNDHERDQFIEQFWERRNPNPGSPVNTFRQEHYRRIGYANVHFAVKRQPGWETDRGHVYIVYGPPDSIDAHPMGGDGSTKPMEDWHYNSIRVEAPPARKPDGSGYTAQKSGNRNNIDLRFVDECSCGNYQLRSPWPAAATITDSTPSGAGDAAMPVPAQPADIHVRKLIIVSSDLSASERTKIARKYDGKAYPADELVERIRQNLRDNGYATARAEIEAPAALLGAPPAHPPTRPIDITVRVSAGAQYRLSGFVIEDAHAFTQDEIVQQFPLRSGDLFNATAIGKGLDRLKTLYQSKGYTRFGAIPSIQMDEARHTVALTLKINEGKSNSL